MIDFFFLIFFQLRFPVVCRPGYHFKMKILRQRSLVRDFALGQCPVPRGHDPVKSVKARRPLVRFSASQSLLSTRRSSSLSDSHSSIQRAAMVRAARLHYQQTQHERNSNAAPVPSSSPAGTSKLPRMHMHSDSSAAVWKELPCRIELF
jgi:hypothetical protein